jgi:hypothetical protein
MGANQSFFRERKKFQISLINDIVVILNIDF